MGFTLIELLIVMAILGVLAVVVLVAINPVQQLARTRDAGRKSAVAQVGRALEAYFTSHGGRYLTGANCDVEPAPGGDNQVDVNWINCLETSGEISRAPASINYVLVPGCTTQSVTGVRHVAQNGLCYAATATGATPVVYARLESQSEASKCPSATPDPYFVWASANGRGGLICLNGAVPAPGDLTAIWNSTQ